MNSIIPTRVTLYVPLCLLTLAVQWGCGSNTGARSWRDNPRPTISGRIMADGKPLPGATVAVNNVRSDSTAVTDVHGVYSIRVPFGWSGILTPQHSDFEFDPRFLSLDEVMSDQPAVDITGQRKQHTIALTPRTPHRRRGINEDCIIDRDCDDDVYCNGFESCIAGRCRPGDAPCDAALTCDEKTHRCVACTADATCDDQTFCNGVEKCVDGRCEGGSSPCPDELFCDESASRCTTRDHGIVGISLIDADSDLPIPGYETLVDNAELELVGLPRLAIRATTHPARVGSVQFVLVHDGTPMESTLRNSPPYALFGAPDGNFVAWPNGAPKPGTYALTVTAFAEPDGGGATLEPHVVHFKIKAPPECAEHGDCDDKRYCNGAEQCTDGACVAGAAPCAENETCDERRDRCQATCADHSECNDGLFCNGEELCVAHVCAVGTPPCSADLVCNEETRACEAPPAKTYYVDDDAKLQPQHDTSAEAGTINNPFRSLRHAANVVAPGDTVIIRAGTYVSDSTKQTDALAQITTSGTAMAPITFKAADGEKVVLSGSGNLNILLDIAAAYINIEGLELTGARRCAIVINGPASHHVNIRMCHAHHNDHDNRFIGAAFRTSGPVEDILFEDCLSNNNAGGFQMKDGANMTVAKATVPPKAGNDGYASDLPEEQWSSWPGWDFAARRVTFRRCIAHNNTLIDEHSDGFGGRYAVECIVEDCISFRNVDDNIDLIGATRCIVRHNIVFQADYFDTPDGDGNGIKIGVRGGLDCIAHHNISFGNRRGALDMADTERAAAYNNTCLTSDKWFGIWFEGSRSKVGIKAQNNICYNNPKGGIGLNSGVRADVVDHNLISGKNRHNWRQSPGRGGMKDTDPMLASDDFEIDVTFTEDMSIRNRLDHIRTQVFDKVRLRVGSPAIDAGVVIPGITADYLGKAPDMGAVESH